jgi:cobalamin synthase
MVFTMIHVLYFSISAFLSMCAVSSMAVGCSCSTSPFPGTTYVAQVFHDDFEVVSVTPLTHIIITFVLTSHMRCSSSGEVFVF